LRLAEDVAVLDNISGGRMELGIGMGYAEHEFAAFGIPRSQRVSRTEEGIHVLRQAWSAEPVRFSGKRYSYEGVTVFPKPVQEGGIPLWMAAQSEPGARRAATFGTHLLPQGTRAATIDPWRDRLTATGGDPDDYRVGMIRPWLITDDAERDWAALKPAEIYRARRYTDWAIESGDAITDFRDPQRIPQTWVIGDADHCAETIGAFLAEHGITDLVTWAAPPGIRPSRMNESLERFARDVLPRLRD